MRARLYTYYLIYIKKKYEINVNANYNIGILR